MQLILSTLLIAAVPYLCFAASPCNQYKSCIECSQALDKDGNHLCGWCQNNQQCVSKSGLECVFGSKVSDKDECPVEIPNGYAYNETLSKKMLLLCFSSYGTVAQTCIDKHPLISDVKVTKQLVVDCDDTGKDTCSGYTAVSTMEKAIILCFRGTVGNEQLLIEAEYSLFKKKEPVVGGGSASKYFYDGYYAVWAGGLKTELLSLIKKYPGYELWVTGHSMGAAFATIAAKVIAAESIFPVEKLKKITYGEPRVGDDDFATSHDALLPYKYRVTHERDLVPHVPPKDFLDYKHHRYEVWYDNDMSEGSEYVVCLAREDKSCSNKHLVDLSWSDHRHYFTYFIEDFKVDACSRA